MDINLIAIRGAEHAFIDKCSKAVLHYDVAHTHVLARYKGRLIYFTTKMNFTKYIHAALYFGKSRVDLICFLDKKRISEFHSHLKYDVATNDELSVELVLYFVESYLPVNY